MLERGPWRHAFRRIDDGEVAEALADGEPPELTATAASTVGEVDAASGPAPGDGSGDVPAGDA